MRLTALGPLALILTLLSCAAPYTSFRHASTPMASSITPAAPLPDIVANLQNLIPKPHTVIPAAGSFRSNSNTRIVIGSPDPEVKQIAQQLSNALLPQTRQPLPVAEGHALDGDIVLELAEFASVGDEGYLLTITPSNVLIEALTPAGLFYGTQTLRQLVPAYMDRERFEIGTWEIAAASIRDVPRFAYRGAMLDVARHFFPVADVKKFMDIMAAYKLNYLHLHLTDDQGWRIEIKSWDKLATMGGSMGVGGSDGGYYSQDDYRELVQYAADRYITIVPEIDFPGHTNAALASYAELNCSGNAPPLYTGTEVGLSSLCVDKELTYKFVDDIVHELVLLTPGSYFHIGGDEAHQTSEADYQKFMRRAQNIVNAYGKQMVGWEEIAKTWLDQSSVAQHWSGTQARDAVKQGAQVLMSAASHTYLDMKYDESTRLGQDWAGFVDVRKAYEWEPTTVLDGVTETDILGVEAPLWTETISTLQELEYMAFPRLIGIAEIGWSKQLGRDWNEYRVRLAAHGPRLRQQSIDFYPSPQVDWK